MSLKSQDCSKLVKTIEDKVEDLNFQATINNLIVAKNENEGLIISMQNGNSDKSTLVLSILVAGAGNCIEKDSEMKIVFMDGTKLTLVNQSGFNCKNKFNLFLGKSLNKESELDQLRTKKIKIMRVYTSKSFIDGEFTEQNQNDFIEIVNCLNK